MKPYFLFAPETGRIVQTGWAVESQLAYQAFPGTELREGEADISSQYFDSAANRLIAMPPRPSPFHSFDYQARSWLLDLDAAWASVRRERDDRLTASDWVILRAADQGAPVPPEWLAYRQALRDVTEQDDPLAITWPKPPV